MPYVKSVTAEDVLAYSDTGAVEIPGPGAEEEDLTDTEGNDQAVEVNYIAEWVRWMINMIESFGSYL